MVQIGPVDPTQRQLARGPVGGVPRITGLEVLGAAVERGTQQYEKDLEESQKRDAAAYTMQVTAQLTEDQLRRMTDMKTRHENVDTFTDTFQEGFDEQTKSIYEHAPQDNPFVQELLDQRITSSRLNFTQEAIGFQAQQKVALQKEAAENALDTRFNTLFNNPDLYNQELAVQRGDIAGASSFMTPAETARFRDSSNNKLRTAKFLGELNRGNIGTAKELIHDAKFIKDLDADTFLSLQGRLASAEKEAEKLRKTQQQYGSFEDRLAGLPVDPISPNDTETMKALNGYYEDIFSKRIQSLPAQEQLNAKVDFANKFKVLPASMRYEVEGQLRGGTNSQQVEAASFISSMQSVAPVVLQDFSKEDIAYGTVLSNKVRAGIPLEKAVQNTKFELDPANASLLDIRKAELNRTTGFRQKYNTKFFKDKALEAMSNSSWWAKDPDLPKDPNMSDAIASNMKALIEDAYLMTGDMNAAQEIAKTEFQKTYGWTTIDGTPRIMRNPPEKFYAVDGTADNGWMMDDLHTEVKKIPRYAHVNREDIVVGYNGLTEAEVQSKKDPRYPIIIKTEHGYDTVVDDKGNMLRYDWKSSRSVEAFKVQNLAAQEQEKQRKKARETLDRARELDRSEDVTLQKVKTPGGLSRALAEKYIAPSKVGK